MKKLFLRLQFRFRQHRRNNELILFLIGVALFFEPLFVYCYFSNLSGRTDWEKNEHIFSKNYLTALIVIFFFTMIIVFSKKIVATVAFALMCVALYLINTYFEKSLPEINFMYVLIGYIGIFIASATIVLSANDSESAQQQRNK